MSAFILLFLIFKIQRVENLILKNESKGMNILINDQYLNKTINHLQIERL